MDWARAIERNSEALTGIVAALFAMLGLQANVLVARIPRDVHRAVLRLLRPAESALRRLIVIAARGLVVTLPPSRPMLSRPVKQGGGARLSFQLFDSRKRFATAKRRRMVPRIHVFTADPRVPILWPAPLPAADPAAPPDGRVDGGRLGLRLLALKRALEDLPRQAKRLARWRARREKAPSPKFKLPLRPGPPPGHRRKPVHEIDEVLVECHGLAFDAQKPDTS